jgi:4-carboxymuconolactone decarboxylase
VTRRAWGNTWQRPGIHLRTRSIVTVSMLVALGRMHELKVHVRWPRWTPSARRPR